MTRIRRSAVVLACLVGGAVSFAAELKIGTFDFQRVSEETARGQQLQSSLAKFRDKKQGEISAKETELKTMRDQYSAQLLSLSPDKRSQMEKDLQKKELEIQSFREGSQREMQLEVNEAQSKFQEQLFGIINSLGKERGYTMIFEKSQAVYFADVVDMTGEVIERFNQETSKQPAASADAPPAAAPKLGEEKKPVPPKPQASQPAKPADTKPPPGGKPPGSR